MSDTDIRTAVLDEARRIVTTSRMQDYGPPENNFRRVALLWTAYAQGCGLDVSFSTVDVAVMCGLIKVARIEESPGKLDHWIDLAGYSACGAQCAIGPTLPPTQEG